MAKSRYRTNYRKDVLNLMSEAFLWREFDYDISAIGSSTPLGRVRRIREANKRLRQKGKITPETESQLNSGLEKIVCILQQGLLNPDLSVFQHASQELIEKYMALGLISREEYEKKLEEIEGIKNSYRKHAPELTALRFRYLMGEKF